MWSKKRRKSKKEKEAAKQPDAKRSQPASPSKIPERVAPTVPERPHPHIVEQITSHQNHTLPNSQHLPNNAHHAPHPPRRLPPTRPPSQGGKSAITVPLPSAPLNTDILESLQSTLTDTLGGTGGEDKGGRGSSNPPQLTGNLTENAEELQKVIERQRSQIELLSQITRLVSSGTLPKTGGENPSPSMLPSRLASRAQTYDYGNQSNKKLEEKALQELDRGYREEGWNS